MKANVNPAQVEEYLGGISYPAGKEALIDHASQQGAPEEVLGALGAIPDRDYESPTDLSKALKRA